MARGQAPSETGFAALKLNLSRGHSGALQENGAARGDGERVGSVSSNTDGRARIEDTQDLGQWTQRARAGLPKQWY